MELAMQIPCFDDIMFCRRFSKAVEGCLPPSLGGYGGLSLGKLQHSGEC